MLGLSSELILTATPGNPRGGAVPISFTSAAGPEMHMVLDDVVRAVNAKYGRVQASKIELSFADKYTPKDGGSIGAAIGTLVLSAIEGYEVDPNLAITGDVTADGKVRAIGGVAAKIRGATAARCKVVGMPSENYDQLVDAVVYEGIGLITNMQVIGIGSLDDAASVARVDRNEKLTNAMKIFDEVQGVLKKTPERIHTKDIRDKLATALDLAPSDYSIKLLQLASVDKQARRLSPGATEYYTFTAVNDVGPMLFERAEAPARGKTRVSSSTVEDGLRKLDKVRRMADPKIIPLVDAWRNFIKEMDDVETGNASPANLENRRQAVLDAMSKLDADRDLMEKMMHEGI